MNQTLTLEVVQKDFQQWRQNRKKRCSIPDELWQKVFPLLNRYPISKICSSLSLNSAQIRENMKRDKPFVKNKAEQVFLEFPLKTIQGIKDNAEVAIEITRKDGSALSVSAFPSHSLKALIEQFLMG